MEDFFDFEDGDYVRLRDIGTATGNQLGVAESPRTYRADPHPVPFGGKRPRCH